MQVGKIPNAILDGWAILLRPSEFVSRSLTSSYYTCLSAQAATNGHVTRASAYDELSENTCIHGVRDF
jgi:hypothetical protein